MKRRPIVAIVGRPNVGKSTLFNRIVGERLAMVHPLPGMTRDRHYADAVYRMRPMTLIDTGGYEDSTKSTLLSQMRMQSIIAMEEADAVIFLAAVKEVNDPVDFEILQKLRSSGKPFFLAVNKCDNQRDESMAYSEFSQFGLDRIYPVSAMQGDGVYDLLDDLTDAFVEWDTNEEPDDERIHVAIVGRQNAGKSTLLNKLFGQERVIANEMAGTTRDAIDVEVTVNKKKYVMIDTAGIRRRGKIERGPEKLSVHSSFAAIERAEVALLVIDSTLGITAQDQHIAGYILERRRACIILLNKWDLVPNREERYSEIIRSVRREFAFMAWAPIMTISAETGQRTHKIWELIEHCSENFRKEFSTSQINDVLTHAKAYLNPPSHKGRALKINYALQTRSRPPRLTFFVNNPDLVHFSYRRYLSNQFYRQLGIEGTPLVLQFRLKAAPRGWDKNIRERGDGISENRWMGEDKFYQGLVYNEEGEIVPAGSLDSGLEWTEYDIDPDEDD